MCNPFLAYSDEQLLSVMYAADSALRVAQLIHDEEQLPMLESRHRLIMNQVFKRPWLSVRPPVPLPVREVKVCQVPT